MRENLNTNQPVCYTTPQDSMFIRENRLRWYRLGAAKKKLSVLLYAQFRIHLDWSTYMTKGSPAGYRSQVNEWDSVNNKSHGNHDTLLFGRPLHDYLRKGIKLDIVPDKEHKFSQVLTIDGAI